MIEEAVTDERLLLEARTDPAAFTRFYRRHATALLGYLVRRTGDPELGADLTAETFACALEGIERFDPARGDPRKLGAGKALGWTTAGDALLYVPPRCGEPGTYRVAADGERERLAAGRLEPSHSPREVG